MIGSGVDSIGLSLWYFGLVVMWVSEWATMSGLEQQPVLHKYWCNV